MNNTFRRIRPSRFVAAAAFGTLTLASSACDRMPLLAPSGTAITILASANAPAAGQITITAILIEGGTTTTGTGTSVSAGTGTPVHNGTLVTFATTIGQITPVEAKTTNGRVSVTLVGDGRTGDATITAFSGPAIKTLLIKFE